MNVKKEILFHAEKLLQKKDSLILTPVLPVEWSGFTASGQLLVDRLDGQTFEPIRPGERWGEDWEYGWFKSSVTVPREANGRRLAAVLDFGAEATVYVDGAAAGAMDLNHAYITLSRSAESGRSYEIVAEAYAGHTGRKPVLGESKLCIFEEDVYQFFIDLECLLDLRNHLDPRSLRTAEIDSGLTRVFAAIDLTLRGQTLGDNLKRGRELMRPLLECVNGSTAPTLYLMGQSHLDVAWLWPLEETRRKIARTLSNQLALMEEYPEYRYTQSQPYLFQVVKDLYPELYERVKAAAARGQLVLEGAMWVEPDTNLPGGESLIRQTLHGKRFFKEEFGVDSEMLWLPDVFGYSGNLPQIMQGCGIRYFGSVKMFGTYDNVADPFPHNTFMWEGIDGSRVLSHLLNYGDYYPIRINPSFLIGQWNDRVQTEGISTRLTQFGHGDGGGGSNRDDLEFLRRLGDLEGVPRTKQTSPIEYYEDQVARGVPDARYVGELYYPAHRGTYTTQAAIKKLNRKAEIGLRETELWSAAAQRLCGRAYPYAELDRLWKVLLLHQFHDILPGSSIHRVHEEARAALTELNGQIEAQASDIRGVIAGEQGNRITVFNSLSWPRQELVALPEGAAGLVDGSGKPLVVQRHEGVDYAAAEAPSVGWSSYGAERAGARAVEAGLPARPADAAAVSATSSRIENEYMAIEVGERGELTSILDKATGEEWAADRCNVMRMYRDQNSDFDAWEIDRRYRLAPIDLDESAEITVTANGPLFANIRVERSLNESTLIQDIRLRAGSRRVEFHTTIHWRERNKLLKVDFPVAAHAHEALHEIQFGHVKRPNHASRPHDADRYEVVQHKWSALAEANRGFALLNDCKYGISVDGHTMSLTLLRAPTWPDETSDRGTHWFTYGFTFWNGSLLDSSVVREAYELNYPLGAAIGSGGEERSLLSLDQAPVIAETVKLAEDRSGDWIVRLYESKGSSSVCRVSLGLPAASAFETNMLEETAGELPLEDGGLKLSFRPFEVKTIRIRMEGSAQA
ncbi:glycoside hydrolase family 38 C-terminal domain-containing protein [Saccharibacillus sp. CPCC 101409]|uniref:alpha-mannosidase n=1 Tax=Saccharibacillus sp. CPCC 101409 TaxID=3058041 RepID=UPI0026730FEB|nr:glycoside hydrolase family 38 C-terminal domain-containing protein [Saccharibacillus sp. CPCC 101409]MDO3411790.1 glycoside hydrolase family 38 C-terminal domain-containing protein [Saccharibacillus sp. CPCC 101409]